jgi:transcriptional regulator GlxA family with amidase domain
MVTTVAILLFEGFEELDAVGPLEVLGTAADLGVDVETRIVTAEPAERVRAAHDLRVDPEGVLGVEDAPDIVVVPGGGWNDRRGAGAWAEAERGDVPDLLADLHARGTTIAGVCTGGMLLARAGLLDGRPAVTHRGAIGDLRDSGGEVVDARVVDDGDVLTAGGVTSGLDLGLRLVARIGGDADAVADAIEYEPQGRWEVA